MRKKMKKSKGFTLVELVVVITIIGVLLAVVVPNIQTYKKNANNSALDSQESLVYAACKSASSTQVISSDFDNNTSGTLDGSVASAAFDQGLIKDITFLAPNYLSAQVTIVSVAPVSKGQWQISAINNASGTAITSTDGPLSCHFIIQAIGPDGAIVVYKDDARQ